MNSVTPSGEPNVFHSHLAARGKRLDICTAFDIFSNGCGKPFFCQTKHQITLSNRPPSPGGASWVLLFPLTFMLALVDGGSAAPPLKTGRAHWSAMHAGEKKIHVRHWPEERGSRLKRVIRGDIKRWPAFIHTQSHLTRRREGNFSAAAAYVWKKLSRQNFPHWSVQNVPGFQIILTHTDAMWMFLWWVWTSVTTCTSTNTGWRPVLTTTVTMPSHPSNWALNDTFTAAKTRKQPQQATSKQLML